MLILDWDVHHGNGTNDIFHADPGVLFVSIHESPLYPGTGPACDVGSGAGEGDTVNLPVPGGTGDAGYRSLVEHVSGALIRDWRPQLVLVSAGFDAHRDDPLATCRVTEAGYAGMTASVRRAADDVGAPVGIVLEGGYDVGAMARSMAALMPVLLSDATPEPEELPVHPLAERRAGGSPATSRTRRLAQPAAERWRDSLQGNEATAPRGGAPAGFTCSARSGASSRRPRGRGPGRAPLRPAPGRRRSR